MPSTNRRIAPHNDSTEERRQTIVSSAYTLLVAKGMEGFRVRDVAAHAKLNHATLLYYFPTKEAILQAVLDYTIAQFSIIHAPHTGHTNSSAHDQLHQRYFVDFIYQLKYAPEIFLVLADFLLYARRDPSIKRVLTEAITSWQLYLTQLFTDGIKQGFFKPDLDAKGAALTIMSFCQGISQLLITHPDSLDGTIAQVEQWFLSLKNPNTTP